MDSKIDKIRKVHKRVTGPQNRTERKNSISSINSRITAEKRTRAKIGRKYDKFPAKVQIATQNRRTDNRLFEIFQMSHNAYFTTYVYLKPRRIDNRLYRTTNAMF